MDDIHQADGVDVEDGSGVGIVAHFRWVAGDADEVVDAGGGGSEQVRLNAEHIAVAAGVVKDRFDADLAAA